MDVTFPTVFADPVPSVFANLAHSVFARSLRRSNPESQYLSQISCREEILKFQAKTRKVEESYCRNLTRLEAFATEISRFHPASGFLGLSTR